MAQIGFIGLGRMGLPMARNLVKAGHIVRAFDVDQRARDAARADGIETHDQVGDVIAEAEFAISMVPTGRQVVEVFTRPDGILSRLPKTCLVIESSTIDIASARALHKAGQDAGIAILDAPVSGGVMGAQAGTLTFMVGGAAADLERARPVLNGMGSRIFHAGPPGNGQAAKICNNLLAGISMIAVSEAFALAKSLGLEPAMMRDISSVSTGGCFSLTNYPPEPGLLPNVPSSRDYQNGFASNLMLKDLRLAEQAALDSGLSLPMGTLAGAIYGLFCRSGQGDLDYSAVIKMIEGGSVSPSHPS